MNKKNLKNNTKEFFLKSFLPLMSLGSLVLNQENLEAGKKSKNTSSTSLKKEIKIPESTNQSYNDHPRDLSQEEEKTNVELFEKNAKNFLEKKNHGFFLPQEKNVTFPQEKNNHKYFDHQDSEDSDGEELLRQTLLQGLDHREEEEKVQHQSNNTQKTLSHPTFQGHNPTVKTYVPSQEKHLHHSTSQNFFQPTTPQGFQGENTQVDSWCSTSSSEKQKATLKPTSKTFIGVPKADVWGVDALFTAQGLNDFASNKENPLHGNTMDKIWNSLESSSSPSSESKDNTPQQQSLTDRNSEAFPLNGKSSHMAPKDMGQSTSGSMTQNSFFFSPSPELSTGPNAQQPSPPSQQSFIKAPPGLQHPSPYGFQPDLSISPEIFPIPIPPLVKSETYGQKPVVKAPASIFFSHVLPSQRPDAPQTSSQDSTPSVPKAFPVMEENFKVIPRDEGYVLSSFSLPSLPPEHQDSLHSQNLQVSGSSSPSHLTPSGDLPFSFSKTSSNHSVSLHHSAPQEKHENVDLPSSSSQSFSQKDFNSSSQPLPKKRNNLQEEEKHLSGQNTGQKKIEQNKTEQEKIEEEKKREFLKKQRKERKKLQKQKKIDERIQQEKEFLQKLQAEENVKKLENEYLQKEQEERSKKEQDLFKKTQHLKEVERLRQEEERIKKIEEDKTLRLKEEFLKKLEEERLKKEEEERMKKLKEEELLQKEQRRQEENKKRELREKEILEEKLRKQFEEEKKQKEKEEKKYQKMTTKQLKAFRRKQGEEIKIKKEIEKKEKAEMLRKQAEEQKLEKERLKKEQEEKKKQKEKEEKLMQEEKLRLQKLITEELAKKKKAEQEAVFLEKYNYFLRSLPPQLNHIKTLFENSYRKNIFEPGELTYASKMIFNDDQRIMTIEGKYFNVDDINKYITRFFCNHLRRTLVFSNKKIFFDNIFIDKKKEKKKIFFDNQGENIFNFYYHNFDLDSENLKKFNNFLERPIDFSIEEDFFNEINKFSIDTYKGILQKIFFKLMFSLWNDKAILKDFLSIVNFHDYGMTFSNVSEYLNIFNKFSPNDAEFFLTHFLPVAPREYEKYLYNDEPKLYCSGGNIHLFYGFLKEKKELLDIMKKIQHVSSFLKNLLEEREYNFLLCHTFDHFVLDSMFCDFIAHDILDSKKNPYIQNDFNINKIKINFFKNKEQSKEEEEVYFYSELINKTNEKQISQFFNKAYIMKNHNLKREEGEIFFEDLVTEQKIDINLLRKKEKEPICKETKKKFIENFNKVFIDPLSDEHFTLFYSDFSTACNFSKEKFIKKNADFENNKFFSLDIFSSIFSVLLSYDPYDHFIIKYYLMLVSRFPDPDTIIQNLSIFLPYNITENFQLPKFLHCKHVIFQKEMKKLLIKNAIRHTKMPENRQADALAILANMNNLRFAIQKTGLPIFFESLQRHFLQIMTIKNQKLEKSIGDVIKNIEKQLPQQIKNLNYIIFLMNPKVLQTEEEFVNKLKDKMHKRNNKEKSENSQQNILATFFNGDKKPCFNEKILTNIFGNSSLFKVFNIFKFVCGDMDNIYKIIFYYNNIQGDDRETVKRALSDYVFGFKHKINHTPEIEILLRNITYSLASPYSIGNKDIDRNIRFFLTPLVPYIMRIIKILYGIPKEKVYGQ